MLLISHTHAHTHTHTHTHTHIQLFVILITHAVQMVRVMSGHQMECPKEQLVCVTKDTGGQDVFGLAQTPVLLMQSTTAGDMVLACIKR